MAKNCHAAVVKVNNAVAKSNSALPKVHNAVVKVEKQISQGTRLEEISVEERVKLEKRIKTVEKKIKDLDADIKNLKIEKERALRFPRLHAIDKQPVFIAVHYGKMYPISDLSSPFSDSRGYDLSHVRVWEEGNRTTIDPIPGKGHLIEKGAGKSARFRAVLGNIDSKKEYISFAVFPDSFGEFHTLKSMFVEIGFDYNWFIIRERLSIIRGKGAGGGQHAQ